MDIHSKSTDRKMPRSDFQSQFSLSKFIKNLSIFFFIEEFKFRAMFFIVYIFWKLQFLKQFVY